MSAADHVGRVSVVAIGGGHGLAMSLRAVQRYAATVTAIVATGDDGGSSGRLRADLDMPAPGDLRRCLTAVASDVDLATALEHRFSHGELAGHAVGNLVLAGLVDAGHDLLGAADTVSRWLGVDHAAMRVVPATSESVCLVARTAQGIVRGQVAVEGTSGIAVIGTDPPDPAVPEAALDALRTADQIVLAPGSFYTSILAAAAVPAIRDAIAASPAPVVFVANLRASEPEVAGFDVARHLAVLADHGIDADVVVAQRDALTIGDCGPTPVVVADIDRPHGLAHDVDLLAAVLADLVPEHHGKVPGRSDPVR